MHSKRGVEINPLFAPGTNLYFQVKFMKSPDCCCITGSVGKSADSNFVSASVDDPDDAFVGFTYVPPPEDLLHD